MSTNLAVHRVTSIRVEPIRTIGAGKVSEFATGRVIIGTAEGEVIVDLYADRPEGGTLADEYGFLTVRDEAGKALVDPPGD